MNWRIGERVGIFNDTKVTGTIRGFGVAQYDTHDTMLYLVELDEGFYNPEKAVFTTLLVAHSDSLHDLFEL